MENFIGQYFKDLQQIALHYLLSNYDYCYLDAMHEKNRTIGSKTIISGSSHAMNGIVETELPKGTINFSISSQYKESNRGRKAANRELCDKYWILYDVSGFIT